MVIIEAVCNIHMYNNYLVHISIFSKVFYSTQHCILKCHYKLNEENIGPIEAD